MRSSKIPTTPFTHQPESGFIFSTLPPIIMEKYLYAYLTSALLFVPWNPWLQQFFSFYPLTQIVFLFVNLDHSYHCTKFYTIFHIKN